MANERQGQAVEASPEEARFLRRFVRRTTLPWFACVGALAGLALGVALSAAPPAALVAPPAAHASAAHDELRKELESLREELASLRSAPSARSALPDAFESRLAKLEAELAARPAQAAHAEVAAPATESPEELLTIRDRLYNLEGRLDRKEQERAALQKDVLARLFELERSAQTEAAARVDNLETNQHRLERLEQRLSTIEALPAAPAAPAPSDAPR